MGFLDKVQRGQESFSAVEWHIMAWLARLVMFAAVAANWKKAADTLSVMSKPGDVWSVWDPFVLAFALEGAFAIAAYFLSMRMQSGGGQHRQVLALFFSVFVLGGLSAVANVDYFLRYSDSATSWGLWRAILMGSAAPVIAVLTAVLAGTVAAIAQDAGEGERQREAEIREYELAMAKQETAQERARARAAKAAIAGTVPAVVPAGGNGNRKWTPERLLAEYPDAGTWTGSQIGSLVGVSERQGRNWRVKMQGMEGK